MLESQNPEEQSSSLVQGWPSPQLGAQVVVVGFDTQVPELQVSPDSQSSLVVQCSPARQFGEQDDSAGAVHIPLSHAYPEPQSESDPQFAQVPDWQNLEAQSLPVLHFSPTLHEDSAMHTGWQVDVAFSQ